MNMIAGAKVSIVDPSSGTTRDRVTAIVEVDGPYRNTERKTVEFVDTGGFGVYVAEGGRFDEVGNDLARLTESIEFQISQAVEGADLVLFAVDAQAGVTPQDQEIARLLREHKLGDGDKAEKAAGGGKTKKSASPVPPVAEVKKKGAKAEAAGKYKAGKKAQVKLKDTGRRPVPLDEVEREAEAAAVKKLHVGPPIRVVATKVDGPKWEAHALELASLGFGEPLSVSAKNNYFRREFMDAIYEMLPAPVAEDTKRAPADLYVAIIGKRNSGKSTLVNTLAGESRMIVSEIAGTTRDAVDVRFEMDGRTLVAIDTAGLRRKRSFQNMIEVYALDRLQRAVDRADMVLLLIDATEKISQVDEQVAMMAQKAFKPAIIVVNKWDLAAGKKGRDGKPVTSTHYEEYIRAELKGLPFAPIAFVSGKNGKNLKATIDLAFELREQSRERVTTGKLNRLVRSIIDKRGPADIRGRFAKVYYVAQTGVEPPTITLVVNHPDLFTAGYLRFLSNRFREELPFPEVPIRIIVRARRQREDDLTEETGEVRVSRGRKGVSERVDGRRVGGKKAGSKLEGLVEGIDPADLEGLGEKWLSDEFSQPVNIEQMPTDADEYFDDEG
jgi:GTP-binding protein